MKLVNTLFNNVQNKIAGTIHRNARRKAIRSTLISVTNIHQDYAGIGFDEQFMTNKAASLMDSFLNDGTLPTVDALTTAWADQFLYSTKGRTNAIANITPMVADFLLLLASEVSSIPGSATPVTVSAQPYYYNAELSATNAA